MRFTGGQATADQLHLEIHYGLIHEVGHPSQAVGPYANSKVIKSTSETYRWLVKSTGNYGYAIVYGLELIEEYKKRYGKFHRTEGVLLWLRHNISDIPEGPVTADVGLAMPEKYKDRADPTGSYKAYIKAEKSAVVSWKHSKVPDWYTASSQAFVTL